MWSVNYRMQFVRIGGLRNCEIIDFEVDLDLTDLLRIVTYSDDFGRFAFYIQY